MSSPVAELEAGLQAMQGLKPPGVSGSRITSLTALCVANVQSESVLIQKLYTHFKKTPGTHKLGVLYVVDSVTRKWLDQARQHGQAVNGSAPDGTYAAGVNRVTELIPVLMNDIVSSAPVDQRDKIKKLVDIWEKGQTFPPKLIESFKEKLASQSNVSTTPPGSPPPSIMHQAAARPAAAPATAAPPALPPNIMETLANLAKQTAAAAPPAAATPPAASAPFGQPAPPYGQPPFQAPPIQQPPYSMPYGAPAAAPTAPAAATQMPSALAASLASLIGAASQQQPQPQPQALPQPQQPRYGNDVNQNLMLVQALVAQGVPLNQISALMSQMTAGTTPGAAATASLVPSAIAAAAAAAAGGAHAAPQWPPNGMNSYGGRSPRGRSRSRSPSRWDPRGSPRAGGRDDRGRSGRDYRQRSPPGGSGRHSPHHPVPPSPKSKWVDHDPSLPRDTIRVLSRTLFVGGVTISEAELRAVFTRFGDVQTCIVNKEKRHAFVKMYTRADAEAAKNGMEHARGSDDSGLRTRWGVGFGPRDCSDYSKGVSVIPIHKLTEADRKWLLTAPWGGSGGRPIATGLVVEEPDIEIGAGVSSKAISRRMQTDRGGLNGPRSTRGEQELANANTVPINPHGRPRGTRGGAGRDRSGHKHGGGGSGAGSGAANELDYGAGQDASHGHDSGAPNSFPFGLNVGANGMPAYPAGFTFPAPE